MDFTKENIEVSNITTDAVMVGRVVGPWRVLSSSKEDINWMIPCVIGPSHVKLRSHEIQ